MQNFFHRTNPIQDYLIYHKPAPKRPIIIILNTYHSSSNEDLACHDDSYYFNFKNLTKYLVPHLTIAVVRNLFSRLYQKIFAKMLSIHLLYYCRTTTFTRL